MRHVPESRGLPGLDRLKRRQRLTSWKSRRPGLPTRCSSTGSGRQVGCTPKRVATPVPQTEHRVRCRACSQAAGTSPARWPVRWRSTCRRRVVSLVQPAHRAASPQGQPDTGQNKGPGPAAGIATSGPPAAEGGPSTSIGTPPPGAGAARREGRSPPTGVPGDGAMTCRGHPPTLQCRGGTPPLPEVEEQGKRVATAGCNERNFEIGVLEI